MLIRSSLFVLAALLTTTCSQADVPRFTPPAERPVGPMERPWPANRYAVLAYHDVEDGAADQRYMSVRTSALNEQFAWLKQNGYQPVSVEQILQAQNGGPALPNKAVLLTFDDGYRSFYSRVFPLLKAYNWPAVLAPVGVWLDAQAGRFRRPDDAARSLPHLAAGAGSVGLRLGGDRRAHLRFALRRYR